MSRRGGKLARKAARVFASEREREAADALGKIRADRDKELHDANRTWDAAVKDADEIRAKQRKAAWDTYSEKRATILKAFAADGVEATAA